MTTCLFVLAHLLGSNQNLNVLGHGMHTLHTDWLHVY
jgi:hypothetical protein